jgi:hypothetical protein
MPYTPELNVQSCCTLRRLAWAVGLPMTTTLNQVLDIIPEVIGKELVCAACKDNSKCEICGFSKIKAQSILPVALEDKQIKFKDPAEDI